MRIIRTLFLLSPFALTLLAASASAGFTFNATTRSEGPGMNIGRVANATIQGWVQGDLGKIEYQGEPGDVISKGNTLLTTDGGKTTTFFDVVRKSCRPWTGNAVVVGSVSKSTPARTISGLQIQKVLDESGPEIAGRATRHFQFKISYASAFNSPDFKNSSTTELVEDLWMTGDLAEPALRIWLDSGTWPSGDPAVDEQIAAALAESAGIPLKRVSKLSVHSEGGRDLGSTITLLVSTLESKEVPADTFKGPFRCTGDATSSSN